MIYTSATLYIFLSNLNLLMIASISSLQITILSFSIQEKLYLEFIYCDPKKKPKLDIVNKRPHFNKRTDTFNNIIDSF